jgi:hypothetical protein
MEAFTPSLTGPSLPLETQCSIFFTSPQTPIDLPDSSGLRIYFDTYIRFGMRKSDSTVSWEEGAVRLSGFISLTVISDYDCWPDEDK